MATSNPSSAENLATHPQARLSMIARTTAELARNLDFGQAIQQLIEGAAELLDAERGIVMLLDQGTRTLSITAATGIDEATMGSTSIQVGFGIAGAVAETGRPLIQKQPAADASPNAERPDVGLCVPIAIHGKLLGVMAFENKKTAARFQKSDLEFAQLIADQAALTLYCDLLHAEFQEELAEEAAQPQKPAEVHRFEPQTAAA